MQQIFEFLQAAGLEEYSLQKNMRSFEQNPDIAEEFIEWLNTGSYKKENPITVEGYSAQNIAEMAEFLDGAGAFNFLITLRERPEKGLEYIKTGFPRK